MDVSAPTFVLDTATWRVHDLTRSIAFYEERLGFRARRTGPASADLAPAADGRPHAPPVLRLVADPVAPLAPGRGAYHVAVRVPTRRDLAAALQRLVADRTPVEGFADHLVSEAIYLPDADGLGVELTWDRPRAAWQYPAGAPLIGTDPLDLPGLLAELGPDPERTPHLPAGSDLGHVHLYAEDVAADAHWYVEALGMDVVIQFGPWGTFLACDGYHHHVGLRRGAGATDPEHDHGLVAIEARLAPARYAVLPAAEIEGVKTVVAPSGHRWVLRPLG